MRRTTALIIAVIFLAVFALSGCGDTKVIGGVEYDTYGLISQVTDPPNPDIKYKPIWGNIVWGCILIETVIAPIYFFGFSMFEPVGKKADYKQGEVTG